MKRRRTSITALALALALTLMLPALAGCSPAAGASDLTESVRAAPPRLIEPTDSQDEALADFAVELFKLCAAEENALISPLSVAAALGMTANGARGETLAQMEEMLGLTSAELNGVIYAYTQSALAAGELKLANSVWFREEADDVPDADFLQAAADYYGASVFAEPFDGDTVRAINDWVSESTGRMITEIIDEIPKSAMMYLINALAFEAEWASVYNEHQVRDGVFTTEAGTEREVELMYSSESAYLEDGLATGFIKYYKGGKYAFAALLPNEGVSVADYIASLTGQGLLQTLEGSADVTVQAALPRFELEYSLELSDTLKAMGMTDAFTTGAADLNGLGMVPPGYENNELYVSAVIHKTYISVYEQGTRAGAAAAVEVSASGAPAVTKTVCLDRPFVYMLIDCGTGMPFFIGAADDIG